MPTTKNILIIQENGRHDRNRHFRECFSLQRSLSKLGCSSTVYGLGHQNFDDPPDFNSFDVILNLENYDTGWVPSLKGVRSKKLLWAIDAHVLGVEPYEHIASRDEYDLILHSTRDFVGDGSVWFPNAYDHTLVYPMSVEKRADVGFCGNINNRGPILEILKRHFNLITDIFVIGEDMVKAINSYKVHFNMNIANDINYRSFETIGCRIPLVTNFNHQYTELGFRDGVNCMLYRDIDELIEKTAFLLANDDQRDNLAQAGFELAAHHTYDQRARLFLDILKGIDN